MTQNRLLITITAIVQLTKERENSFIAGIFRERSQVPWHWVRKSLFQFLNEVTVEAVLTRRSLTKHWKALAVSIDSHAVVGSVGLVNVGGQRLLTFRNKLRDVATYFLLFPTFSVVSLWRYYMTSLLLRHSTWSLAFLLWIEQLVRTFHI